MDEKDNAPDQCYSKSDEDDTGYFVDDREGLEGELGAQLVRHHHFSDVRAHIHQQTYGKNNNTFLQRMRYRKDSSISQPEQDNPGVQGIDDKSRRKDPGRIPLAKTCRAPFPSDATVTFLKKIKKTPIAIRKPPPPKEIALV